MGGVSTADGRGFSQLSLEEMLGPLRRLLGEKRVILASGSPRRKEMLENIGFPFEAVPSNFEESMTEFKVAWECAVANAVGKAQEVADRLKDDETWAVVVGADTVVFSRDQILGKPGTPARAREMLAMLNGHTHQVCTGVALVRRRGGERDMETFHEVTEVTFAHSDDEVLESYVQSGEPLDKAGGYGIQGLGGTLVEGVRGDYFNVVGLPLHRLCLKLTEFLKK